MQEEVTQKVIALIRRAEQLTENELKDVIRAYLRNQNSRSGLPNVPTGKTTVKKLLREGQGASTIDINADCMKDFERIAKKYHVQYAVRKDKSQSPPKYVVFFKARETDVIQAAFKEFVGWEDRKKERPSVRRRLKEKMQTVQREGKNGDRQKDHRKEQTHER